MLLIIGLGNPGIKYQNNRHNVGFMLLDYLVKQIKNPEIKFKTDKYLQAEICETTINNKQVILAKPQNFMNNSGIAVNNIVSRFKFRVSQEIIIVHDDLDIPLGKFKIQKGTGPQLHNGIESIEKHLHTKDFLRIRIGVDNRLTENRINGEAYVLQDFKNEEKLIIKDVFLKIFNQLKTITNI